MMLLLGALTIGLILAMLAFGVYLSFRIFNFPDITADGSVTLGAAVSATLLVHEVSPVLATLAGFAAGAMAGALTGILHTRFSIHGLLSGILVMTALYSINLHVMGRSNVPLTSSRTLFRDAEDAFLACTGGVETFRVSVWEIGAHDLAGLALVLLLLAVVGVSLYGFFRTNLGTAMRAGGDTATMARALGRRLGRLSLALLAGRSA